MQGHFNILYYSTVFVKLVWSTLNMRLIYWKWDWYVTCNWCLAVKCHNTTSFQEVLSLQSHTVRHICVVVDRDPKLYWQRKRCFEKKTSMHTNSHCTTTKIFLSYLQCVLSLNICLYLLFIFLPFHWRLFSVQMTSQVHHTVSSIKARFSAVPTQRMIYMTYLQIFSISINICIQNLNFSVQSFL